ncbi:MAG: zinc ribbon domain-containing protein [Pyrinomonadaceae bacterium]|nr:zinc ribbon domain-containing protein [Pyrinomonadaceae bacterium]
MSANLLITSSGSGGGGPTDLLLRRVIAGDMESVRAHLIPALERMGYVIVTEDPPMAQREARGWAKALMSNDILDYSVKLIIGLKQMSPAVTRATFNYSVNHPFLTKGDRQTIGREADAIISLASVRASATCSACGADTTDDSRFCRLCGAPHASIAPTELEVVRLTAGARAGHQTIVTALIILLVGLLVPLVILVAKGAAAVNVALLLLAVFGVPGVTTLLFGVWRLHRTLNPPEMRSAVEQSLARVPDPVLLNAPSTVNQIPAPAATTGEMLLRPIPSSVTEGTTELLRLEERRSIKQ